MRIVLFDPQKNEAVPNILVVVYGELYGQLYGAVFFNKFKIFIEIIFGFSFKIEHDPLKEKSKHEQKFNLNRIK